MICVCVSARSTKCELHLGEGSVPRVRNEKKGGKENFSASTQVARRCRKGPAACRCPSTQPSVETALLPGRLSTDPPLRLAHSHPMELLLSCRRPSVTPVCSRLCIQRACGSIPRRRNQIVCACLKRGRGSSAKREAKAASCSYLPSTFCPHVSSHRFYQLLTHIET